MSTAKPHTLIIGYGNPGRQDDGLGSAMIEKLRQSDLCKKRIALSDNYQLTVEDAIDICDYERVIFVDAAINLEKAFVFYPTEACTEHSFGSHSVSPEGLLQLASTLYQKEPEAYVLAIQGKEFDDFKEALSSEGELNLNIAYDFLYQWLHQHEVSTNKSSSKAKQKRPKSIQVSSDNA